MTGMSALLLFAAWTLAMMLASRAYRLTLMSTFQKPSNVFPRGIPNEDPAFFVRAEHAHLNCLENLPVFGAIVLAAFMMGQIAVVDAVAGYIILARVAQSVTHLIGTSVLLVWIRATFFIIQLALFIYLITQLV